MTDSDSPDAAASRTAKAGSYHHGDLRNALVSAAHALLERHGLEALSLRAVAREAGVSAAAPYHHFKDKDALLAALAADAFSRHDANMRAEADRYETPFDRLAGLGVGYVRFARENPADFALMRGGARHLNVGDAALETARGASQQVLFDHIASVLRARGGDPGALDRAAAAAWAVVHGLATLAAENCLAVPDGYADPDAFTFDVLRRGLADIVESGA